MKKYELDADDINVHNSLIEDKIGNKEYLSSLIRLIASIDDNEVICVDGDWGVGKTFLVKQLEYLIKYYEKQEEQNQFKQFEKEKELLINLNRNNLVFYYNAWKNDDHSDVLESIIFNVLNEYPKYKDMVTSKFDKEKALKELLNILTKIVSQKLFNIDFGAENIDKIKTFNDLSDKINTFEERKELFKVLINNILGSKRLILIIDELDRCNPKFATKLLEVVKHFYDLKNMTIIIVSNNKELQHTIKQQYGQNFDSYTYLNRFYDYTITIDSNRSVKYAQEYLNYRVGTYLPHDVFYAMIQKYKFSFRDCNRYRILYDASIKYIEEEAGSNYNFTQKERWCLYSIILPIVYAFKVKDFDAYYQCLNGEHEKLKETLYYLNDYFNENKRENWLREFVEIDKKREEISKEDIINEIARVYMKAINSNEADKIFLKAIKLGI